MVLFFVRLRKRAYAVLKYVVKTPKLLFNKSRETVKK